MDWLQATRESTVSTEGVASVHLAHDAFADLLSRLGECHERALEKFRKDNTRLAKDNLHLQTRLNRLLQMDLGEGGDSLRAETSEERPAFSPETIPERPSTSKASRRGEMVEQAFSALIPSTPSRPCEAGTPRSTKRANSRGFLVRGSSKATPCILSEPSDLVEPPPPLGKMQLPNEVTTSEKPPIGTQRRHSSASVASLVSRNSQDDFSPVAKCSSLVLDRAVANLRTQSVIRQKQRFRQLLDLRSEIVTPSCLMQALQKRGRADYTLAEAQAALEQMRTRVEIEDSLANECGGLDLENFVQQILPEFQTESEPGPEMLELQRVLLPQVVDEVIEKVTKSQASLASSGISAITEAPGQPTRTRRLAWLNAFVGTVVVLSITTLGVSMDVSPSWNGWVFFEMFFGIVFVGEVMIKLRVFGLRKYMRGPGWRWNWFDMSVTFLTLVDVTLSAVTMGTLNGAGLSAMRFTMMLRAFRLTRLIRLVKLLHTPILADLANMLAGFQVGAPCLLWVMVLLFIIFYVFGMISRQLVGPSYGDSHISACGLVGDMADHTTDGMCQAHLLYGEEFFGSLQKSMFTVFRCVLGDCSSASGKSLVAAFSSGYGTKFELVYCSGMVLVVFGLFNIIAAIFVETTISGLKYNNVQRKYARTYESRYVQRRLEALVTRVQEMQDVYGEEPDSLLTREIALNEDEFDDIMHDDEVNAIFEDLDINVSNRAGLFDLFDSNDDGLITISELVATLMKMRGEPQKSDMIASWVALRSLNERFTDFERLVLENQKKMLDSLMKVMVKGGS